MSFRLYGGAWVRVEGLDEPVQVQKDPHRLGAFLVAGHSYDIDARPITPPTAAPAIAAILSIQAVHEAGLRNAYLGKE